MNGRPSVSAVPGAFPYVGQSGTEHALMASNFYMDDDEREAIRAEGLDPDDPAVRAAIDLVRWELELLALNPLL
jgi:hypothetical protein